mmetsp:Transcript_49217/g.154627  ORF Transcript_49217/g.154627 Transcript_49217/m.154627 type:complete len:200 (-) Transcript_49217:1253-1852(-)
MGLRDPPHGRPQPILRPAGPQHVDIARVSASTAVEPGMGLCKAGVSRCGAVPEYWEPGDRCPAGVPSAGALQPRLVLRGARHRRAGPSAGGCEALHGTAGPARRTGLVQLALVLRDAPDGRAGRRPRISWAVDREPGRLRAAGPGSADMGARHSLRERRAPLATARAGGLLEARGLPRAGAVRHCLGLCPGRTAGGVAA